LIQNGFSIFESIENSVSLHIFKMCSSLELSKIMEVKKAGLLVNQLIEHHFSMMYFEYESKLKRACFIFRLGIKQ
jgi:hypothetical protein